MAEITFESFIAEQDRIYQENFRNRVRTAKEEGFKRDNGIDTNTGYGITLLNPEYVNDRIAAYAERFKAYLPAVVQGKNTLHTSLGVNNSLPLDDSISMEFCELIHSIDRNVAVQIYYPAWLFNQTTVIVEGHPEEPFVYLVNQIQNSSKIQLTATWGSHITNTRFLGARKLDKIAFDEFQRLINEAPIIGTSKPTHIKVGYQIIIRPVKKIFKHRILICPIPVFKTICENNIITSFFDCVI